MRNEPVSLFEAISRVVSTSAYLLKKWWIILPVTILFGAGGVYYATLQKAKYESMLTFSLEDNSSGGGLSGALSLAAEFGFSMGTSSGAFAGDNILEILTSRRLVERVLLSTDTVNGKATTLANELIDINGLKKALAKKPALANIAFPPAQDRKQFSYLQDSILFEMQKGILENALKVRKPDKKLNLYEIKYVSLNERFAKIFAEVLIRETTAFYTELRSKRSKETLDILEKRVASLKGSMNSAITTRASIPDLNANPAFSSSQAPLLKQEADVKVYGGAYGEMFKNLEMARYQYLKDLPLLQIIDEPNYPMKKIKQGRLYTGIIFSFVGFILIVGLLILRRIYKSYKRRLIVTPEPASV